MESSLRTNVGGVNLETPVIVASGVWPMDPRLWPAGSMEGGGAVCSKGMTFEPREGNRGFRIMETYAGILNSIGRQNYGVEHFIAKELPLLDNSCRPVIVNIAFETLEDLRRILERLKVCRSMVGVVERNVSCPNVSRGGLSWGVHTESLGNAVSMARQVWEGPLWVKLSPQVPSMGEFARLSQECGAQAVVVGNTWLGMAIDNDLERPFFENVFAGLSGPAIFPLALRAVWEAAGAVNIPVIGCGGIARPGDALSMILAGASAVEVGTALFIDSGLPASICRELEANLTKKGLASVRELGGRARNDQGENGEKSR